MKRLIKISSILVALSFMALSCVQEGTETLAPGTFEIDTDQYGTIALEQYSQTFFIPVKTNVSEADWLMESDQSWCQVGLSIGSEKGIMLAVEENTDKEQSRPANISIGTNGQKKYTLKVIQTGYGPAIIVSNVIVGPEGGKIYVDVVSNVTIDEELLKAPMLHEEDNTDEGNWITFAGERTPGQT